MSNDESVPEENDKSLKYLDIQIGGTAVAVGGGAVGDDDVDDPYLLVDRKVAEHRMSSGCEKDNNNDPVLYYDIKDGGAKKKNKQEQPPSTTPELIVQRQKEYSTENNLDHSSSSHNTTKSWRQPEDCPYDDSSLLPPPSLCRSVRSRQSTVSGAFAVSGHRRNSSSNSTTTRPTDDSTNDDIEAALPGTSSPSSQEVDTTTTLVEAQLVVEPEEEERQYPQRGGGDDNDESGNAYPIAEIVNPSQQKRKTKLWIYICGVAWALVVIGIVVFVVVLFVGGTPRDVSSSSSSSSASPTTTPPSALDNSMDDNNSITAATTYEDATNVTTSYDEAEREEESSHIIPIQSSATITYTEESSLPLLLGNPLLPGFAPLQKESPPLALSNDGTMLAVASMETAVSKTGTVRVYRRQLAKGGEATSTIQWEPIGNPIRTNNQGDDNFAFTSLAMTGDGSRLVVGASKANVVLQTKPNETISLNQAGRVYVYDLVQQQQANTTSLASWTPVGTPALMTGLETDDMFGRAVAVSNDGRVVAGASYRNSNDKGKKNAGNIMIFQQQQNEEGWKRMGQILLGGAAHERLGRSLALSKNGTRLAAGASQSKGTGPGFVQVWDYNDTHWNPVGQTLRGDNLPDVFGRDVDLSLDGSILACGANLANITGIGENTGLVRIYRYDKTNNIWNQLGQDLLGDTQEDRFGTSISLSENGTRIAIGASQKESGVGYVRIYDFVDESSSWEQVGTDFNGHHPSWTKVGTEVSMSKDGLTVASGGVAPANEEGGFPAVFQAFNISTYH